MDDEILDEILFETMILHQQHEQRFTPKEIRELIQRFGIWIDRLMKMFSGHDKKEKFKILDEWKKPWV